MEIFFITGGIITFFVSLVVMSYMYHNYPPPGPYSPPIPMMGFLSLILALVWYIFVPIILFILIVFGLASLVFHIVGKFK